MKLATITKDNDCLYLTQEIDTESIYERAKIIVKFCDKETKLFEKEIDRAILEIFERNGINIPNTSKSVLKLAFDLLKSKGKGIEIRNLYAYKHNAFFNGQIVKETNLFTIYTENDCGKDILQCGVQVLEKEL